MRFFFRDCCRSGRRRFFEVKKKSGLIIPLSWSWMAEVAQGVEQQTQYLVDLGLNPGNGRTFNSFLPRLKMTGNF